jgi:cell division transport system permease protein
MRIVLKRIFKLGWKNVSRNIALSLVAVFVITTTIVLATFVFAVKDFSDLLVEDIKDKMSISVYLKDGVDEETVLEVKEGLLELEETRSVKYISKEEALESFMERYKDDPMIMASLAEVGNPLLSSLSIKAENIDGYEVIAEHLNESPLRIFFEKIDYDQRKTVIQEVFRITELSQKVSFSLAAILALIAISIVFNTIRLAIYGMRDEIKTMRLVGVSNRFISGLFVSQGIIIGLVSFLASFLIVFGIGIFLGENLKSLIPGLDLFNYLKTNFSFIFLLQIILSVSLGVFSSVFATSKYLKE